MLETYPFPRVKVCGLAREEDVLTALRAGAEALGFVLHPGSPRAVSAATARLITQQVPRHIPKVCVLVDTSPRAALEVLAQSGLGELQLCGAQQAPDWVDFPVPILRRIAVDESGQREMEVWSGVAAGFVLDHPASAGGSGQTVDLELARDLCRQGACLLAGGLDAENVAEAIGLARPRGVDASSRLEQSPGVKDSGAVEAFTRTALTAFAKLEA